MTQITSRIRAFCCSKLTFVSILLVLTLALSLSGCTGNSSEIDGLSFLGNGVSFKSANNNYTILSYLQPATDYIRFGGDYKAIQILPFYAPTTATPAHAIAATPIPTVEPATFTPAPANDAIPVTVAENNNVSASRPTAPRPTLPPDITPTDTAPATTANISASRPTPPRTAAFPPADAAFIWPMRGIITTYFSGGHPAIDVSTRMGTPIVAALSGVVSFAGWTLNGYGNLIEIEHGWGRQTRYAHLSDFAVSPGQHVEQGQIIGYEGSTGNSTGPHLHFEIILDGRNVNPLLYLSAQ